MALVEPLKPELTNKSAHLKKYSSPLRLWHWLSAIVISGSLLTVLADSTITDGRDNAGIIQKSLSEKNISVSDKQAWGAAHEIGDKVWALHTYFGYTLIGLFVFRLILELFQRADQEKRALKILYHRFLSHRKLHHLFNHWREIDGYIFDRRGFKIKIF